MWYIITCLLSGIQTTMYIFIVALAAGVGSWKHDECEGLALVGFLALSTLLMGPKLGYQKLRRYLSEYFFGW